MTAPPMLTPREMADEYRIGRHRAYRLIREGHIRTITCGGRLLIPRHEIERVVAAALDAGAFPGEQPCSNTPSPTATATDGSPAASPTPSTPRNAPEFIPLWRSSRSG